MSKFKKLSLVAAMATLGMAGGANASLSLFQSFTGDVGMSTAGCGSTTQTCTMTVNVPTAATVVGVYLYSSLFATTAPGGTLTLGANSNNYGSGATALGINVTSPSLQAWRKDVTSTFAAPMSAGGAFTFTVTETNGSQDGEGLVVVWRKNVEVDTNTVFVLDGSSSSAGDSFSFGIPTITATSTADMRLGIGFSFDGTNCAGGTQTSSVRVNGTLITANAGCNDDSIDATPADGNLITVGGDNDPYSPLLPTIAQDHERYNLASTQLNATSLAVATQNTSRDDNIFLAAFQFSGRAVINPTVPEPTSMLLLGAALIGLGVSRRKRTQV